MPYRCNGKGKLNGKIEKLEGINLISMDIKLNP
jgi:hypothetical protein